MMKHILLFLPVLLSPAVTTNAQTTSNAENELASDQELVDTLTVHGRALNMIGSAQAASEGIVGYADFEDRPLARVGELVEVIPGVVATQHSGEGKANQYFLRGFNLDHGTDFSASVDGVPVNMRTHGHGQGYLDLNFVIPEIVERVDFRKGPYRASTGDFSAAGSAHYSTYDSLDQNFVEVSIGEYDYFRAVGAGSLDLSDNTTLLLALEANTFDGPWVLDQALKKFNGLAKLTHDKGPWRLNATASVYDSDWTATDQVPLRAVNTGSIGRFGFIDPDLGGETSRLGLSGGGHYRHSDGAETEFQAYFVNYDFSLFSNFTYFANDPVNGDEFEQRDKRSYVGANFTHSRDLWDRLKIRLGAETRWDDITDLGLFNTNARTRLTTVRQDEVKQVSLSLWGEAGFELSETLRANLGLRGDYFDADVTSISEPLNSGPADDSLLSPSAGLAWQAVPGLEFYANYGRGFHSNDVRGATITIDPLTALPVDQVPILVSAEGVEVGARWQNGPVHASVALFSLDLDSELVFVGDAGTTEPNDASTRQGIEASLFWKPNDWFVADLSGAYTDAKFDISGNAIHIPGAVETVFGGGVLAKLDPWTLSARLRHFGKAPLIEDNSVTSEPTTLVNLAGSYDWNNIRLSLEVLNLIDAEDADITYLFESQLAGEPVPVEDIHFHPVEPRQLRVSVRYNF